MFAAAQPLHLLAKQTTDGAQVVVLYPLCDVEIVLETVAIVLHLLHKPLLALGNGVRNGAQVSGHHLYQFFHQAFLFAVRFGLVVAHQYGEAVIHLLRAQLQVFGLGL